MGMIPGTRGKGVGACVGRNSGLAVGSGFGVGAGVGVAVDVGVGAGSVVGTDGDTGPPEDAPLRGLRVIEP